MWAIRRKIKILVPLCIRKTWLPFILVKKTICDSIRCFLTSGVFYFLYSLINTHHYFACLKNVFSINLLNCKTISFSLESLLPVFLDEMLPTTNCMCVHTHTHTHPFWHSMDITMDMQHLLDAGNTKMQLLPVSR